MAGKIAEIAMLTAGGCYIVAAVALAFDGKMWTSITIFMYSLCCVTIWLAGAN